MKRLAIIATLLLLTGCGQLATTSNVDAVVLEVKKLTVQICQFLPTDDTVVKIITADAFGAGALAVATAICQAVTAPAAAPTAPTEPSPKSLGPTAAVPCPTIKGVCVEGKFVPKDYDPSKEGK